jgi:hypothetical protein
MQTSSCGQTRSYVRYSLSGSPNYPSINLPIHLFSKDLLSLNCVPAFFFLTSYWGYSNEQGQSPTLVNFTFCCDKQKFSLCLSKYVYTYRYDNGSRRGVERWSDLGLPSKVVCWLTDGLDVGNKRKITNSGIISLSLMPMPKPSSWSPTPVTRLRSLPP